MKYLVLLSLLLSSLAAEKTLCYKNNVGDSTQNKKIILEGGKCQKLFSADDMLKSGWKLDDFKVNNNNGQFNHVYLFSRQTTLDQLFKLGFVTPNVKITPREFNKNELVIYDVTEETAKVKVGNLRIGQSGIIVNDISGNYTIITQGTVIETNKDHSVIEFVDSKLLKQDAIPTLKTRPTNSDLFILNHLYSSSLLIVPNVKAKKVIKKAFPDQNFLNEDFFAAYLKVQDTPVPTKQEIIDFCSLQEIGTIFIVIKNQLFIIDALSFKTIDEIRVPINNSKTQLPFFTRIQKIEKSIFDIGGADDIGSYNDFYLSLIKDTGYIPESENTTITSVIKKISEYLPW